MEQDNLGFTFKDKVCGMEGVCVGYASYFTGCTQLLLQPKGDPEKTDTKAEPHWFDIQRCEKLAAPQLVVDNLETPGCDKPAPTC